MTDFERALQDLATADAVAKMKHHFEALVRWNAKLNLTSVRDPEEIVRRHFLESLQIRAYLPTGAATLVDIGSGGGFPGMPLAASLPDLRVTLLESHGRKSVFLKEVARVYPNVIVLNKRLEDVGNRFDVAISRGVSWQDMREDLMRLASRFLLVTTESDADEMKKDCRYAFETAVPMIGIEHGVLLPGVSST